MSETIQDTKTSSILEPIPEITIPELPITSITSIIESASELAQNTENIIISTVEATVEATVEKTEQTLSQVETIATSIVEKIESIGNNLPDKNSLLFKLDSLYIYVKSLLGSDKITPLNIIKIINDLMQIVETYKGLTGNQKQMLILNTLKKLVNDQYSDQSTTSPEIETERALLLMIIDHTAPNIINTLVSAINGDIKFSKSSGCDGGSCFAAFTKLFNCCKGKK